MNKDRILKLLATDLSNSQVASIVGVSPAVISQLLQDENFKERLEAEKHLKKEENLEQANIDNRYLATEHRLLSYIEENLPAAEFRDAVVALRIVSERQQKNRVFTNPVLNGSPVIQNLVQVMIPTYAIPKPEVSFSDTKEVTSIGNRTLAPLSSEGVLSLFNKAEGTQNELPAIIPSPEKSSEAIISSQEVIPQLNLLSSAKRFLSSFGKNGEVAAHA